MLLAAIRDFDIDPARSIMIGDKRGDIEAAATAAIGFSVLIGDVRDNMQKDSRVEHARSLLQATEIVRRRLEQDAVDV